MQDTSRKTYQRIYKEICLKEMCFRAAREHFAVLGVNAVLDLPTPLIKDLLPHLTVCQLDEVQPSLNQRGISTHSGWIRVLKDMCGPNHAMDFHTEEQTKHEVMRMLFTHVFYGFSNPFVNRNITNLNTPSFLKAAAKCIEHFLLSMPVESLVAEQRYLLHLLEQGIRSVRVSQCIDLSRRKTLTALYVLHRLLDHGVAKKIVIYSQCHIVLAWIIHGRGSQYENPVLKNLMHSKKASCVSEAHSAVTDSGSYSLGLEARPSEDQDPQVNPRKRLKLDAFVEKEESGQTDFNVDPQVLCQTFTPCDGPMERACLWGQIECLDIRQCMSDSLRVLICALPTFFCLRCLTLQSSSTFRDSDVLRLARALKQLSESSRSSLTSLSIGVLPHSSLVEILVESRPNLTSLHVEIQTVMWGPRFIRHYPLTVGSDVSAVLSLEKLVLKVTELQTDLNFVTSLLRCSPHLTSLHVAGMRLPAGSSESQLLTVLSDSNHCLKSLNLEDMKLSDCLTKILALLRDCKLEELRLNDCRLLEKWNDKEESLQQLVAALKRVSSLHLLSLAQNRLAKNVCVLAELFSGSKPSSVKHLDISSNFIKPAELLEFAERLKRHPPPHRLTLDLRKNPADRDLDTWAAALRILDPFCVLRVEEGWDSTNTMADHISNM